MKKKNISPPVEQLDGGDYLDNVGPLDCYTSKSDSCGRMEYKMKCSKETKVKFQAEIIAPDANSDSFFVQMKGGRAWSGKFAS